MIDDGSDESSFLYFLHFFFLSRFFFSELIELLSFDELDVFDDDSDNDGSGSRFPGTCDFSFFSGDSVSRVSGVGSGIFVLTGIKSIGDVVPLVCLYQEESSPQLVYS